MKRIGGWHGELGLRIRYHVPQVATLCRREPCVVEIEPGDEALYPFAAEHIVTERVEDSQRHGAPPDFRVPETRFRPDPYEPQHVGPVDVVACPRKREYGAAKNWDGWPELVERLPGNVFAAGAPDSSYDVDVPRAWDFDRFLDASIEAMRSARLVIATDAGLAHLAVLCGAPLLLVTYRGLVAPGPVIDSRGRVAHKQYWPVRFHEYYEDANHMGVPIVMVDGWEDPGRVVRAAERMLERAA